MIVSSLNFIFASLLFLYSFFRFVYVCVCVCVHAVTYFFSGTHIQRKLCFWIPFLPHVIFLHWVKFFCIEVEVFWYSSSYFSPGSGSGFTILFLFIYFHFSPGLIFCWDFPGSYILDTRLTSSNMHLRQQEPDSWIFTLDW